MIDLQLFVEGLFVARYAAVKKRVKGGRVVMVAGVAEFVEDDKLAQMLRQEHEKQ